MNSKKNVLYITYVDYKQGLFPGVEAKIAGQMEALQENGYCVDRINQYGKGAQMFCSDNTAQKQFPGFQLRRFSVVKAVYTALKLKSYVAAYIRFQFFSEDVRIILKMLRKHSVITIMELPTYPYEGELHQQGLKGEIKLLCDRIYRKSCAKYLNAFVTQAEVNEIYSVRCIKVLNGLDFSKHLMRDVTPALIDELHIAAVASMLPWHGYDRILRGMVDYYSNGENEVRVFLHLIGKGKELEKYRRIVEEGKISEYVVFHGMQGGLQLREIISECQIAAGSLAAFRIGLKKLSTLKSREYCAWGFPTINATETDILDENDPFCMFVAEDETAISMEEVVRFYKRVYFESGLSEIEIAEKIRNAAIRCSDIRSTFKPVIDYIVSGIIA